MLLLYVLKKKLMIFHTVFLWKFDLQSFKLGSAQDRPHEK